MAIIVVGVYFLLVRGDMIFINFASNPNLFLIIFACVGFLKISMGVWVILQWMNEYYEITPDYIIHKSGIIFKNQQRYRIELVRLMKVTDSFLGELFNYGDISLYDVRLNKYLNMYMIHNPQRYANVLKELKPTLETKTDRTWIPWKKNADTEDVEAELLSHDL
jgi:hypothetical protein